MRYIHNCLLLLLIFISISCKWIHTWLHMASMEALPRALAIVCCCIGQWQRTIQCVCERKCVSVSVCACVWWCACAWVCVWRRGDSVQLRATSSTEKPTDMNNNEHRQQGSLSLSLSFSLSLTHTLSLFLSLSLSLSLTHSLSLFLSL